MSLYRQVAALRASALADGSASLEDANVQRFSELLLKCPEHTWGFNAAVLMTEFGPRLSNAYLRANYNGGAPVVRYVSVSELK